MPDLTRFDLSRRQSSYSKRRLQEISHHFIGQDQSGLLRKKKPLLLPVLLLDDRSKWVARHIASILANKNRIPVVVYVDRCYEPVNDAPPLEDDLYELTTPLTRKDDWIDIKKSVDPFMRATGYHFDRHDTVVAVMQNIYPAIVTRFSKLLIQVPATMQGVRKAYSQLRTMRENLPPRISVVMTNGLDSGQANLLFNELEQASSQHLNISLTHAGYLSMRHEALDDINPYEHDEISQAELGELIAFFSDTQSNKCTAAAPDTSIY